MKKKYKKIRKKLDEITIVKRNDVVLLFCGSDKEAESVFSLLSEIANEVNVP